MTARTNTIAFAMAFLLTAASVSAAREIVERPAGQQGAFSPAVITKGGKIVWLAGHSALTDLDGKSIAYDFDAQVTVIFKRMEQTLARAGAKLTDLVTLTTFLTDARLSSRFSEVRRAIFERDFPKKDYPASALITVTGLAAPGMMVEVQGIAVVDDK
jgi:2-iminobutanoate/2-iminopropanoate deaminase